MDLARLDALEAVDLACLVKRALDDETAWPTSWTYAPLGPALVNPATAGIFEVRGLARTEEASEEPWRVVLKVVKDFEFGDPALDAGYMHDEADWNYWKRELLVRR